MSFGLSRHTLPALGSYKDVHKLYTSQLDALTPRREQRGAWGRNCLPLRAWADQSKRIEVFGEGADRHYRLYYYRTPILFYYADGRVSFNAAYDTPSTRVFFEEMCPSGWRMIGIGGAYFYVRDNEWHTANRSDPLCLAADGTVLNGIPYAYTKKYANMDRRREIRKQLKAFYQWFKAMTAVSGSMLSVMVDEEVIKALLASGALNRSFANLRIQVGELLETPENEDLWRSVCTNAFLASGSIYELHFAADRFDGMHAKRTLDAIERALWRECGGWENKLITVPAGEKP